MAGDYGATATPSAVPSEGIPSPTAGPASETTCCVGLARFAFLLVFGFATLPAWLYAVVTDTCCVPATVDERRRRGRFLGSLISVLWRAAWRVCCWIRIDDSGLAALKDAGQRGRQVFIALNHASWLDTPLICAFAPAAIVGDMKTLMARGHLRLPVLGRLAQAVGHMPVPFTHSASRGNFAVDKDKLQETMALVDEHVSSGGHLAIFPEGDLNRDWRSLLQFRAGGLEICIRHDMEVWGWVLAGTAECWPESAALGGGPARLRTRAALLYPSAREAAQRLAGASQDLREQAVALANDMRATMQQMLDALAPSAEAADKSGGDT